MMERRTFLASAAIFALALPLGGCGDDQFPDYHYKMMIYVGDKAYSSVRAIEQKQVFSAADSSGHAVRRRLHGQAVILDLLDGRTVYALLSKPDEFEYALNMANYALLPLVPAFKRDPRFDDLRPERGTESLDRMAEVQRQMVAIKGEHELPRMRPNPWKSRDGEPSEIDAWPIFVTFDDPVNPKSVHETSPASVGVSRIAIEITDENVTKGIEKRLPWVLSHIGSLVRTAPGQSKWDKPPVYRLNRSAFTMDTSNE